MKHEVKVPEVGESIAEVTIATWLKKSGDFVNADDLICEIESDKASFEIPAEASGVLQTLVEEGDTIAVGDPIASIDTEASNDAASQKDKSEDSTTSSKKDKSATKKGDSSSGKNAGESGGKDAGGSGKTVEIKVPAVGESISEVSIAAWLKPDGSTVAANDLICEIESDKASFEIPAESGGVLKHMAREGDVIAVGSVIAQISGSGSAAGSATEESSTVAAEAQTDGASHDHKGLHITPTAAKILSEAGIDGNSIKGSGPGGLVKKEDALAAVRENNQNAAPAKAEASASPAASTPATETGNRVERREKMSTLRKTIGRRLVAAKNETAMLTTFNEADMTEIKNLRAKYKEIFKEKYEVGLGFMSFFTRAVCIALKEWPAVNAMIDDDMIQYNDYCDISIAVSTPKGLVVPVVRNAESLSLAGIESEIRRIAGRARDGKLTIDEMTGGTFTITNGGVFGSLMSTPIINAPQSAILGMHKIMDRPMVVDGQVAVRPMMYIALSYDHRIVDGRESVSFLVRVKELLEDPARMLLEV